MSDDISTAYKSIANIGTNKEEVSDFERQLNARNISRKEFRKHYRRHCVITREGYEEYKQNIRESSGEGKQGCFWKSG